MSIFKSTLKPFVVRQINTRQNLLSEIDRTGTTSAFNQYVSGKMPWVKMTSFVDYKESQNLAKSYILLGGTLHYVPRDEKDEKSKERFYQRSGINSKGASYGGSYGPSLGSRQYGARPMPGITSIKTRSLAAYGSLTETTIKFYAWDKKQLEDLSILYMRPGYQVLVEWGWSMYLNTYVEGDKYQDKTTPNQLNTALPYNIASSPFLTVDAFDPTLTQEGIYYLLENYRVKYAGNYDGTLGSIVNFEYVLMPNGGYECTTVLKSIGDVIDTIRINNTTSEKVLTVDNVVLGQQATGSGAEPELKTQFELLMDQYASLSEVYDRKNYPLITEIDKQIKPSDNGKIDKSIYRFQSILDETTGATRDRSQVVINPKDNKGDRRSFKFIQFGYLIHILNYFKNIYGESQQKLFDIEIPSSPTDKNSMSNGLCIASYNSISVDPSICLIRNPEAALFSSPTRKGFDPNVVQVEKINPQNINEGAVVVKMKPYLYPNTNLGLISNIYLNINKIVEVYKAQSRANNGYVYLGEFISELLSNAAYALGSINDFDKFVNDNKIVIIDKHYTELPSESLFQNKYKVNISGNNTIVRDHKIMSKIFPSQASMIAIAAQDRENISAIQTSTYNYLNKDIKSRLFKNLSDTVRSKQDIIREADIFNNNVQALIDYVDRIVLSTGNSTYGSTVGNQEGNVGAMNAYLNSLLVQVDRGTDYKAIIPISVDLKVDGISGLTIGEIFTLNKDVLPKDYEDKKVGFIVTGISNEVNTNSWTTNITAMVCLLDQLQRQKEARKNSEDILKRLNKAISDDNSKYYSSIAIFNVLAGLAADLLRGKFIIDKDAIKTEVLSNGSVIQTYLNDSPIKAINQSDTYTRVAIINYASSVVDFETVLRDLNATNIRLYPFPKAGTITPDNVQNLMSSMGLFVSMDPQIKNLFLQELDRVIKSFKNQSKEYLEFRILDPNQVSQISGTFNFRGFSVGYYIKGAQDINLTGVK